MSIIISDVSYHYFNQQPLFEKITLSVPTGRKVSVIGNNGTGKSTLLKLISGELSLTSGSITSTSQSYYIPQQLGINDVSVAVALGVAEKLKALHAISEGSGDLCYYEQLGDDWDIESRCRLALNYWGLGNISLTSSVNLLSGGEKTKLFLSGILIHKPDIILLDEPTNHLDFTSRQKLYSYIADSKATIILVSHDITLLNLIDFTYELTHTGIKLYGGNYDFYLTQKEIEESALEQQITSSQASLRSAKKKAQEVKERQEKRSRQGEKNKDQIIRILRKGLKDSGEKTGTKLKEKHANIITENQQKLSTLRQKQRVSCELKIDFDNTRLHNGKLLVSAEKLNFEYVVDSPLWESSINLEIRSGERVLLRGDNGSGKTTLVKLIVGELESTFGSIVRSNFSFVYLDQEYSKVNMPCSVLEMAQKYNLHNLEDHQIKLRLNRALFGKESWDKDCQTLSGGERMRLYLCCLMISNHMPDLFILDEPTNNLDLTSLAILTNTIRNYRGTILVISHDMNFVDQIGITKVIELR